jgi:hypothetical protein
MNLAGWHKIADFMESTLQSCGGINDGDNSLCFVLWRPKYGVQSGAIPEFLGALGDKVKIQMNSEELR